jgi:hypothetical protein
MITGDHDGTDIGGSAQFHGPSGSLARRIEHACHAQQDQPLPDLPGLGRLLSRHGNDPQCVLRHSGYRLPDTLAKLRLENLLA